MQHCCNIVSNGYNIVPTLQRCIALKIVVANRPVEHHLYTIGFHSQTSNVKQCHRNVWWIKLINKMSLGEAALKVRAETSRYHRSGICNNPQRPTKQGKVMLRYAITCKPLQTRRPPHSSLAAYLGLNRWPSSVVSRLTLPKLTFNHIEFFVGYPKRGNSHFTIDCFLNGTCKPQFFFLQKLWCDAVIIMNFLLSLCHLQRARF